MGKDDHLARFAKGETGPWETSSDSMSVEDSLAQIAVHDDPSTTVAETLESISPSVSRPLIKKPKDFKGKHLGSYEIQRLIGKGGIGLVYLAFDHRLTRRVALKLLRTDDPEAAHRLLDEARAQARVEHENVCQVYEAGEVDGQTYIAMQYIEGKPLNRAFQDMTLEEMVQVIQRVAEGLETAHAQNLIHRDVKPGNILVERTPRGEWKPYILDFGLAREQAAPGETTTGEVKGTPSYMPPEQVAGQVHSLDARADVYSLGATFYEGISGRQLFPDTSGGLAVMLKVLNEDPEPIRAINRSVPIDIESIIMRCLEKDPHRRYASARELGEDLQRFLDGEPILARPIGPLLRLWRRLKKRRVAVLTTLLVITVLTSVTILVVSRMRAGEKARWMNQYRQEVRLIEERIEHAYKKPLHDVTDEKVAVLETLAKIEKDLETQSSLALGPANYALGSGYLALHNWKKAHHHLSIAWDRGTRDPEVGYALGRALGARYETELQIAQRIEEKTHREDRMFEIEERFRRPALDHLRQSRYVEEDSAELVEALMAFWEGKHQVALTKADDAYRQVPWLYEALTLQGDVHAAVGLSHFTRGDYNEAQAAYRRAQAAYEQAAETGRSDARIYEGQASLGFLMMEIEFKAFGGDVQVPFEYGLEASRRSRTVDPTRAESYELESMLSWRKGNYNAEIGIDPTEYLTRATEAANQALEVAPKNVQTYVSLGWSQSILAFWQIGQGLDPRAATELAVNAFSKGTRLDPQVAQSHHGLGHTHNKLALWEIKNGHDATQSLSAAIDSLERAVVLEPEYFYALEHLGDAYANRAVWEFYYNEDPAPSVEGAVRVYTQVRDLNPRYVWSYYGIGDAWTHLAHHQLIQGEDPTENLLEAQVVFEKGLEVDPAEDWFFLGLGRIAAVEGRWRIHQGGDPTESFTRAREYYDQWQSGQSYLGDDPWGFQCQASLAWHWARWKLDSGLSPQNEIDRGLRMAARGLEALPKTADIQAIEGVLRLLQAEADPGRGRQHRQAAQAALEAALEMNSNLGTHFQPFLDQAREEP